MEMTQDPMEARIRDLASVLIDAASDRRAGLGCLVREIEAREPGFIQRIAAVDHLRRIADGPHGGS